MLESASVTAHGLNFICPIKTPQVVPPIAHPRSPIFGRLRALAQSLSPPLQHSGVTLTWRESEELSSDNVLDALSVSAFFPMSSVT